MCCFVVYLSLYLGGCTICACYKSVGGQCIAVSSWLHASIAFLDLFI